MNSHSLRPNRHPHLPDWNVTCISLVGLVHTGQPESIFGVIISPEMGAELVAKLEYELHKLPERTLVGLDFKGIASMGTQFWSKLGPSLVDRVMKGEFGPDKRLIFLIDDDSWLADDLQWAFEFAASGAKEVNRAVLVPALERGYCGVLAPIYEESLELVNRYGSMSTLELYAQLQRRYKLAPAHADRCLAVLSQIGLLYRESGKIRSESAYDLNARGYALSIPEELISNGTRQNGRDLSGKTEKLSSTNYPK